MGYFEKPSAPKNLVLPKPVAIPRRDFMTKGSTALILVGSGLAITAEGCNATSWIDTALSDLPAVLQIITSIAGIIAAAQGGVVSGPLLAQINSISNQVQTDLNLAKTLITEYQSGKDANGVAINKATVLGKIDATLVTIQDNLNAILQAFHVSDPILQSTIAASIGLAIATVLGIQALIPAPPAATAARLSIQKQNGANAIKEAFNVIVGKNYPSKVLPIS